MGYIEPRDNGRHRAQFRNPDGTKTSRTFDYRYEAEQWLHEVDQRLADARNDAAARIPGPTPPSRYPSAAAHRRAPHLADLAASWLRRRKPDLTGATFESYDREVRRLTASPLAQRRVDAIRKRDVETWLADLADLGAGNATRRINLKVIRMVLNDAIDNGELTEDPTRKIALPRAGTVRPRVLTPAEEARLLLAAKTDPRAKQFFLCALDAGLRWGEIAGLSAAAVEADTRMLDIWQVVDRKTGLLRPFPKDHDPRRVPMTKRLTAALSPLVEAAQSHPHGLLFTTGTGAVLDPRGWARDFWYPARAKALLTEPQPRFHDLRHTFGTRLHRANVPIREIATVMGHEDEAMTSVYIHEMDERARGKLIRSALARYA